MPNPDVSKSLTRSAIGIVAGALVMAGSLVWTILAHLL